MTTATINPLAIDPVHFRSVMGYLPTGVVALTGFAPEATQLSGLIVGTFASLSLEPALMTFSVAHTSSTWPTLRAATRFSASVLAAGQEAVCRTISSKRPDKFDDVDWYTSPAGLPRITGAHAWIDCELQAELDGGDHTIVIARVLNMDAAHEREPLIFHQSQFGRFLSPQTL